MQMNQVKHKLWVSKLTEQHIFKKCFNRTTNVKHLDWKNTLELDNDTENDK